MNKLVKTGLLTVLLVVPVFVYLFLKVFGKNELKLPVYFAYDSTKVQGGYKVTSAHTIPDFHFTRENGQTISGKDLKGFIYVADFIFTRCQGICPKMTTQLTTVQETFRKDDWVKII